MNKKICLLSTILFLIVLSVSVNAYSFRLHEITAEIDEGFTNVNEKYYLDFDTDAEYEAFKKNVKVLGRSLISWKMYEDRIFPHVRDENDQITNVNISFDDKEKFLELSYVLLSSIVTTKEESDREKIVVFNIKKIPTFSVQAGTILIPKGTSLKIVIPSNAKITETSSNPVIRGNEVIWEGYLSTSDLTLEYSLAKPLAPQISLSDVVQETISREENLFTLVIILLIVIGLYWKREKISNGITSFVVEHSEISKNESE